jgi:hypothetical protein
MRINRLKTENNSTLGKIKELTIYHVLKNPDRNTINGQNNSFINTSEIIDHQNNINNSQLKIDIKKIENNFSNQSPISNSFKSSHPPDFLDDEYILELHKKLEEKREQRKISEQNVKILNGRVRCLKDENKKMCAKIDLTKKKTKEKEIAINNHRSRSKEKEELQEKKKKDLKILTLKNRYQKLITQTNLINTKENLFLKNKLKGQISKAQKIDNENIKKENELNTKIINKNKTEVARFQTNNNNQKKKIAEIKKKEELIKSLEAKINMENKKKKELEDEMKKLNIIENEILGRIYANNEMQRKLIENFEKNFGQGFGNNTNDVLMSINNINNSYVNEINGLDQFYNDYE